MIIGIDIGTTNVKAAAVDGTGRVLAVAERINLTEMPQAGWQEQNPEAIFQNVVAVLRDVLRQIEGQPNPRALVFSAGMHSLLAVDAAGNPLTNAWLWSDLRSTEIAESLKRAGSDIELYRHTGVPVHPMSPLCKIIWLREQRRGVFEKTHKFLGIKDFVLHRLTESTLTDLSLASATGLMNLHQQHWDAAALLTAGIDAERLPALVSPYHQIRMTGSWCAELGWPESAPVIAGASDGCLANLGAGATGPGDATLTIGTSGAVRLCCDRPLLDPAGRTFCYRLDEETFVAGGATNNGANVLAWVAGLLGKEKTVGQWIGQASEIPPGADGLLFLPYLHGERAPLWDAQARGTFHGLHAAHGPAHLVRAAMEGITANLCWISALIESQQPIGHLFATGGFSASPAWLQLVADIFEREIRLADSPADASVLGAVLLARRALGETPWPMEQPQRRILPDPALQNIYRETRQKFQRLWLALQAAGPSGVDSSKFPGSPSAVSGGHGHFI